MAGAVEALLVAPLESDPKPPLDDEPLLRSLCEGPVPELAAARPPPDDPARELVVADVPVVADAPVVVDAPDEEVVVVVELAAPLVELVAILSIVAPRPAVPAEAPPPDEPPPLPVLDDEVAVIVGVLVRVAPAVAVDDALVPVLVKVRPDVTSED